MDLVHGLSDRRLLVWSMFYVQRFLSEPVRPGTVVSVLFLIVLFSADYWGVIPSVAASITAGLFSVTYFQPPLGKFAATPQGCELICDGVMKRLGHFVHGAPQSDDITMLAVSYRGHAEGRYLERASQLNERRPLLLCGRIRHNCVVFLFCASLLRRRKAGK